MKKIFLLTLLAVFFTSCGDDDNNGDNDGGKKPTPPPGVNTVWLGDWNDRNDPAFKPEYNEDYCPMFDQWQVIKKNGQPYTDILIYEFGTTLWSIAKRIDEFDHRPVGKEYLDIIINNKQIKDKATGRIFEYQLRVSETEDKLIIFDGRDTFECEMYKYSRFEETANWNSIWNRHYDVYKGKYNPIKGKWKAVKQGDVPIPSVGYGVYYYEFTDGFRMIYTDTGGTPRDPNPYSLNNKYVNISNWGRMAYKLSNDTLYWELRNGRYNRILVKEK